MPTAYIQLGANCSSPSICPARAMGCTVGNMALAQLVSQFFYSKAKIRQGRGGCQDKSFVVNLWIELFKHCRSAKVDTTTPLSIEAKRIVALLATEDDDAWQRALTPRWYFPSCLISVWCDAVAVYRKSCRDNKGTTTFNKVAFFRSMCKKAKMYFWPMSNRGL